MGRGISFDEHLVAIPGERLRVTATGGPSVGAFTAEIILPDPLVAADVTPRISEWGFMAGTMHLSWQATNAPDVELWFNAYGPNMGCTVPNTGAFTIDNALLARFATEHVYDVAVFAGATTRVEPEGGGVVVVRVGDEKTVSLYRD